MWSLKGIGSRRNHRNEQKQAKSRAAAAVCERLEGRQLLTAYTYRAEPNVDTITVVFEYGYLKVRSNKAATILYPEATSMVIIGNAKNNTITIDRSVKIPVVVKGGAGNDLIVARGSGDCLLMGEGGNDTLIPGNGNDTLSGGGGIDTVDFSAIKANLEITIDDLPNDYAGKGRNCNFMSDIEVWIGGKGNDYIEAIGLKTNVTLMGGAGDDTLLGGDGNDSLIGGGGINVLDGGKGKNTIKEWGASKSTTYQGVVKGRAAENWRTAAVYATGGTLTVRGTLGNDQLVAYLRGDGQWVVSVNRTKWVFSSTGIDSVCLLGGAGNDRLEIAVAAGQPLVQMKADGAQGRNTIIMPDPQSKDTDDDSGNQDTNTGSNGSDEEAGAGGGGWAAAPDKGEDAGTSTPNDLPVVERAPFTVYDSTGFMNKPDLSSTGVKGIYLTAGEFWAGTWPKFDTSKPDETATRALARKVSALGQMLVIDIEHWPIDIRYASDAAVQASIDKLVKIVDWVHDERPDVKVGIYGILPIRDYYAPYLYFCALEKAQSSPWWSGNLPRLKKDYENWQQANDRLKGLAEKVDFIAPSIYTFYTDQDGWKKYAIGQMEEAKRYNKPVLPVLWMDYHNSNGEMTGQELSKNYWRLELNTVAEYADGVIVWGGWKFPANSPSYRATWDENAAWWTVLKDFTKELYGNR